MGTECLRRPGGKSSHPPASWDLECQPDLQKRQKILIRSAPVADPELVRPQKLCELLSAFCFMVLSLGISCHTAIND